jgi:hypothetical protein
MTKDEALKLALEALTVLMDEWTPARQAQLKGMEAVKAIKQALAAPVQEPRARLMTYIGKGPYPKQGYTVARTYEECPENQYPDAWIEGEKLYTAPPASPEKAQP